MTPFELDILLHYYCKGDDHNVVVENPSIWPETRKWFLDNDLLRLATDIEKQLGHESTYRTTNRANILIEHILDLPLPEYRMPL